MKPEIVVKPSAEHSPKVVPAPPTKVVQSDPKTKLSKIQQVRDIPLSSRARDHTEFAGYPHWGINE